jgi:hypothetical protein
VQVRQLDLVNDTTQVDVRFDVAERRPSGGQHDVLAPVTSAVGVPVPR